MSLYSLNEDSRNGISANVKTKHLHIQAVLKQLFVSIAPIDKDKISHLSPKAENTS